MNQLTRKLSVCKHALNTSVVIVKGVYKTYDADGSGLIGADELPAAFRAAGECFFFSFPLWLFKCLHSY